MQNYTNTDVNSSFVEDNYDSFDMDILPYRALDWDDVPHLETETHDQILALPSAELNKVTELDLNDLERWALFRRQVSENPDAAFETARTIQNGDHSHTLLDYAELRLAVSSVAASLGREELASTWLQRARESEGVSPLRLALVEGTNALRAGEHEHAFSVLGEAIAAHMDEAGELAIDLADRWGEAFPDVVSRLVELAIAECQPGRDDILKQEFLLLRDGLKRDEA